MQGQYKEVLQVAQLDQMRPEHVVYRQIEWGPYQFGHPFPKNTAPKVPAVQLDQTP